MKNAQLKSIGLITFFMILGLVSVYALSITINHPTSEWIKSSSVIFNATLTERTNPLSYCAIYTNRTGTLSLEANYSFPQNGTFTRGIAINDSIGGGYLFGWNVTCSNGTKGINAGAGFAVDGHPPTVILGVPDANTYQSNDTVNLTYTPIDSSNLVACNVYHNLTGTWHQNVTNSTGLTSGTQVITNFYLSQPDGKYVWNVNCSDRAGNMNWGEVYNRTLIVDVTRPKAIVWGISNNTVKTNSTPLLEWNLTIEPNFQKYVVNVYNYSTIKSVVQTKTITSITENYTTLDNLGKDGVYYFNVTAYDLAGNSRSTTLLYYTLDRRNVTLSSNYPSSNAYTSNTTPDFNITVVDDNPDTCTLYLSTESGTEAIPNMTKTGILNGTQYNLTPLAMAEGSYKWNIECNDTFGRALNLSTSLNSIVIDKTRPTQPNITSLFHAVNNTDLTPELRWVNVTEGNFSKYVATAYYINNNSQAYQINTTGRSVNYAELNLVANYTYNFTVVAYDLAGNYAGSENTTAGLAIYVDPVCGILNPGWNVCGATWTTAKKLSLIGNETGARLVTVWNLTHEWATCNSGVSTTGSNCDLTVGIANNTNHAVWVYVNSSTNWQNRTWVAKGTNADYFLTNVTNGTRWNLEAGFIRGGRVFGDIKNKFTTNVSLFSMPYNNGTSASYVNSNSFAGIRNTTNLDYGRAIWFYWNGTGGSTTYGNSTFNVGSW